MAKTIMISNDLYDRLKKMKEKESFTKVIGGLLENAKKEPSGKRLLKFFGALEGDTEYDEVMKEVKKSWSSWSKKYA